MDSDTLAEDIVQDVFLKIWKKRSEFDIHDDLKSYLFTSVRNRSFEHLRRDRMISNHEENIKLNESLLHETEIDEIEKYVRLEKIYQAINTLPTKCKEVFSLSKINGLSYAEIAEHLNISVKTVENQIIRALKLLREKVNK